MRFSRRLVGAARRDEGAAPAARRPTPLATLLASVTALAPSTAAFPGDLPAPLEFSAESNGGWFGHELRKPPVAGKQPNIVFILMDDYGWADASWHRTADPSPDVRTPNMDQLLKEGIEFDRHCARPRLLCAALFFAHRRH